MEGSSIVLAFVLVLAASSTTDAQPKSCEFGETAANEAAKLVNDLAVKLHNEIAKPDSNSVFSPAAIAFALALIERGAGGTTKDDILKLIGSKGSSDSSGLYQALQHQLQMKSEKARLNIANGLFHSDRFNLKPDYVDEIKRCLETETVKQPFQKHWEEARRRINAWIADKTENKIPELVKPGSIDRSTLALLANAVYLKAPWFHRMVQAEVHPFYQFGKEDQAKTVGFMSSFDGNNYTYYSSEDFDMVELKYADVPLSMFIILPKQRDGIAAIEKSLTGDQLISLFGKGESRPVALKLPVFPLRHSVELKRILVKLGLDKIFSDQGNFSRMATNVLKFNNGFHESVIGVYQNGTEPRIDGVDSNEAGLRLGQPRPVKFIADHPFIFAVVHKPTSAIVLMGKVNSIDKQY